MSETQQKVAMVLLGLVHFKSFKKIELNKNTLVDNQKRKIKSIQSKNEPWKLLSAQKKFKITVGEDPYRNVVLK